MPEHISIPIAGEQQVYDVEVVKKALAKLEQNENPSLKRTYVHMIQQGGIRWLLKPSSLAAFDWLYEECPNFSHVIDDLKKSLHLAMFGNGPVQFTPILLTGAPGVGKTHFAKCLGKAMATEFEFVSMATATAGWILSGAGPTWKGAKEGRVANKLVHGTVANPLFLLDELDKSSENSQHSPSGALYELMESETSQSFRDEFLDVEINCSSFCWVATANYIERIDSPIRKRMKEYEIHAPTSEQGRAIGKTIYSRMLSKHGWAFDPVLPDDALEAIQTIEPREIHQRILDALGAARVAGRTCLRRIDFENKSVKEEKRSIGF